MVDAEMPALAGNACRPVDDILARAVVVMRVVISDFFPVIPEVNQIKVCGRYPERRIT